MQLQLLSPQPHLNQPVSSRQLFFQRKVFIARAGHIAPHYARRADLQFIEVAFGIAGQVGAENAVQFAGGVLVDILGRFGVAVGFQVDIPQVLVQLGQSQLDAGLHRVHIDGRQLLACDLARHIKLTAEHEFDQLHQNAILGAEHILEGTDADIGFLDNFGNSGAGIAFFQKEPNTGR